jgi:DNA mismatch endonuclease Vsr
MSTHRATRSYNMSRIKGKDTKPEMVVRRFLHAHGFRYRLHDKKLPGKPDMVVPEHNNSILCRSDAQINLNTSQTKDIHQE